MLNYLLFIYYNIRSDQNINISMILLELINLKKEENNVINKKIFLFLFLTSRKRTIK